MLGSALSFSCSLTASKFHCSEGEGCPDGYTCDAAKQVCVRTAGAADGGAGDHQPPDDAGARDAAPADLSSVDHSGVDLGGVDRSGADRAHPDTGAPDRGGFDRAPQDVRPPDLWWPDLVPPDSTQPDRLLPDGALVTSCTTDDDCRLGCSCIAEGQCQLPATATNAPASYCAVGPTPTCLVPATILVDTLDDSSDPNDARLSLREALSRASAEPSPHRIVFDTGLAGATITLDHSLGPLPPVPSLTYLEGSAVTIEAAPDTVDVGLTLEGSGVVVSDLQLAGFTTAAMLVKASSFDVHVFHVRLGRAALPNHHGVVIEESARRVVVGRGRELPCVAPVFTPLDSGPFRYWDYDINVIAYNSGDGITASGAHDVRVYGTWIGFDNNSGGTHHDFSTGNLGMGLRLTDVDGAVVGTQHILPDEAPGSGRDPLAAGVGIGRNGLGGVLIQGGGEIRLPGLFLGNTPSLAVFDQNYQFNLKISGNTGTVIYGRAPGIGADLPPLTGLSHSEGAVPIIVEDNQAPVLIWGIQNQCLIWTPTCPDHAVEIGGSTAPVLLYNNSFLYDFGAAPIEIFLLGTNGSVELINNLFWHDPAVATALVHSMAGNDASVVVRRNMQAGDAAWCEGDCSPGAIHNYEVGWFPDCRLDATAALEPTCPHVDLGELLTFQGAYLDFNGFRTGLFNGCGPDIGFYDCKETDCLEVTCP